MSAMFNCEVSIGGHVIPAESVTMSFAKEEHDPGPAFIGGHHVAEWSGTIEGADAVALFRIFDRATKRARIAERNRKRVGRGARRAHRRRCIGVERRVRVRALRTAHRWGWPCACGRVSGEAVIGVILDRNGRALVGCLSLIHI